MRRDWARQRYTMRPISQPGLVSTYSPVIFGMMVVIGLFWVVMKF